MDENDRIFKSGGIVSGKPKKEAVKTIVKAIGLSELDESDKFPDLVKWLRKLDDFHRGDD